MLLRCGRSLQRGRPYHLPAQVLDHEDERHGEAQHNKGAHDQVDDFECSLSTGASRWGNGPIIVDHIDNQNGWRVLASVKAEG